MNKNVKRVACLIFAGLILCCILLMFTGCNYQMVDTNYSFERAIIQLPNGEIIEGKVDSWKDFEDGDQVQVKIDGVTYLVRSNNCVLISGGKK